MWQLTRTLVGACFALGLCGCAETHRGFEVVAQATSPAVAAQPVSRADDEAPDPKSAVDLPTALPSPKDIFDFHPAGSPPDTMRQAFIIDPNDGPLAGDVRRTAAELKTFLATVHAPAKSAEVASCPTPEGRRADVGCVKPPRRTGVVTSRDPLALQ